MYKKARYIVLFLTSTSRLTDILFSLAAKVDSVAPMKNHVAGAVKDKLLKELEGRTGETDSEDSDDDEAGREGEEAEAV
jgi:hypothetical protein